MALTICEDAWNDKHFWNKRLYTVDPVESLVQAGGNFVLNISASPFWMGKRDEGVPRPPSPVTIRYRWSWSTRRRQ